MGPGFRRDDGLEELPIESLRIDSAAAQTLRRLGLKTVGALLNIPRASLARRFRGETIGENVLMRLDEMMGQRDEPLNPAGDDLLVQLEVRNSVDEETAGAVVSVDLDEDERRRSRPDPGSPERLLRIQACPFTRPHLGPPGRRFYIHLDLATASDRDTANCASPFSWIARRLP